MSFSSSEVTNEIASPTHRKDRRGRISPASDGLPEQVPRGRSDVGAAACPPLDHQWAKRALRPSTEIQWGSHRKSPTKRMLSRNPRYTHAAAELQVTSPE